MLVIEGMRSSKDQLSTEQWESVITWLKGRFVGTENVYLSKDEADALDVIQSIPGTIKFSSGTVYRGIFVGKDTVKKILSNKPFSMDTRLSLESWTRDINIARAFAPNPSNGDDVGFVLERKVSSSDIAFENSKRMTQLYQEFRKTGNLSDTLYYTCLLYTSPSPRD